MNWKQWLMATPIYDLLGKRSYAQSGEDLIADIELGKKKTGFYVDIGAYHPKLFSNTYLFYKKGWMGVCVEPNLSMGGIFKFARPNDIFLNCGVGIDRSAMEYFEFNDSAANTFSSVQAHKNEKEAGRKLLSKRQIETKTLKDILDQYVPKKQGIDLLSVDVEGLDEEVLRSGDWKRYRPKVVICEDLEFDFGQPRKSKVVLFLEKMGYILVAKTPYSLIFKEKNTP
jgi:FkbM family methyltransferase